MRNQRRAPLTVTVVQVSTDVDKYGDGDTTLTSTVVEGATFEPERMLERAGDDQAPVLRPAHWNIPGVFDLDADDLILPGDVDLSGGASALDAYTGDRWLVVGGSAVWLDRTKVPVQQPRSV